MSEELPPDVPQEGGLDAAKASAALNALEQRNDDDVEAPNKSADAEALGKAMKDLDVKDVPKDVKKEPAKKFKIDATDVALLVKELEMSKAKSTELLKAHEGDAVKALTAYITAPV